MRYLSSKLVHGWIPARAAQMSFYFFLSAFPMLLIMVAVLSQFRDAQLVLRDNLVQHFSPLAPPSMLRLIADLFDFLAARPKGLLSWGVVVALWAASSGMVATIDGLNQAYSIAEDRPWWKRRLVGLTFTLAAVLVMSIAMVLLALGIPLAEDLTRRMGLGTALLQILRLVQWPAIFGCTLIAFDLLYYFGPNRQRVAWRWFPTETLIAIALWLAASLGLRSYMIRFGNYSVVYGALGGVIVFLLWFYFTAIAILAGAHVAAQFDHRAQNSRAA